MMIDTDVFIRIFRGDAALKTKVDALSTDAAINTVVYLELIQGAQNDQQLRDTEAYLTRFYRLRPPSRPKRLNLSGFTPAHTACASPIR